MVGEPLLGADSMKTSQSSTVKHPSGTPLTLKSKLRVGAAWGHWLPSVTLLLYYSGHPKWPEFSVGDGKYTF